MKRASLRVLIGTVGGQGGGVLSDWLIHGLLNAGWDAMSVGLLGMSQRGGTVTYYCEASPEKKPGRVNSVFAVPGDVNMIIGQELLELGRFLSMGYAAPDCIIVGNTRRTLATLEKMPAENGIYDSSVIISAAKQLSPDHHYLCDAQEVVASAGLSELSSNALLLGMAVGSPTLQLTAPPFFDAIRSSRVNVEANLKAFEMGFALAKAGNSSTVADEAQQSGKQPDPVVLLAEDRQWHERIERHLAGSAAELVTLLREATSFLADYQDEDYAAEYLKRVEQINRLPGMRPAAVEAFARQAALWMGYEDIPRVAQLKVAPQRLSGLHAEHSRSGTDTVKVTEFLCPDLEQVRGLLPTRWTYLLDRHFGGGQDKAWAMRIDTTSVRGYWMLKLLSGLRRWRRHSSRYQEEMQALERWTGYIRSWQARSPELGQLVAEAGRVVKGYGRVRRMAYTDLWGFCDRVLPLLAQSGAQGETLLTNGRRYLKLLAAEAGQLDQCLTMLDRDLSSATRQTS